MPEKNIYKTLFYLLLVLLLIILTTGIYGYWYFSQKNKELTQKNSDMQKEIDDLNKRINDLNTELEEALGGTTACDMLTDAEEDLIKDWVNYENFTYNYSFKHPRGWQQIDDDSSDRIFTFGLEGNIKMDFEFITGEKAKEEIDASFHEVLPGSVRVACQEAKETIYNSDTEVMILVSFERNNVPFKITFTYSGGLSNADIETAQGIFELILKTITFY